MQLGCHSDQTSSRLGDREQQQSTVYGLKSSLSTQRRARPSFDPRRGHHGRFIVPDPAPTDTQNSDSKAKHTDTAQHDELSDPEDDDDAEDKDDDDDDDDIELEDVPSQPTSTAVPVAKRARFD